MLMYPVQLDVWSTPQLDRRGQPRGTLVNWLEHSGNRGGGEVQDVDPGPWDLSGAGVAIIVLAIFRFSVSPVETTDGQELPDCEAATDKEPPCALRLI